jgi:hypothetical protein
VVNPRTDSSSCPRMIEPAPRNPTPPNCRRQPEKNLDVGQWCHLDVVIGRYALWLFPFTSPFDSDCVASPQVSRRGKS